jgi:hypothetical protein
MLKKTIIILALILLTSALLGSSVLTRGHFWGDDFAAYIGQAQSIAHGEIDSFVVRNAFTVTQSSHDPGHQMGPAAYPWGFPLMLVPVYTLIGLSPLALKLPGLLTYLGFLIVLFLLTKRRFTLTESLIAVSLFAFNPELLRFLDNILSDIPFLFLSTLTILLADTYTQETQDKRRLTFAVITGTAIFAAFFVRTQGMLLLGAVLLWQGIRFLQGRDTRRQTVTEALITVAGFGILWGASSLIFLGGQTSYLSLYSDFSTDIFFSNVTSYSQLFDQFFLGLPGSGLVFGIFVVLFFIGVASRWKDDLLFVLYGGLYLLVLWSWPEWQGFRFLFPMLPFFIYFAFWGFKAVLGKLEEKQKTLGQLISYAFLLFVLGGFLIIAGSNAYGNISGGRKINGPFDPYSIETYDFIKDNTSPDSIIVFFKPRAMRLMTNRDSLALNKCERMFEGDYLALSKKVGENLQIPPERIDECNLPLDRIFQNRRFIVYKIEKTP